MSTLTYESHATVTTVKMEGKVLGHIHARVTREGESRWQYVPRGKTAKGGGKLYSSVEACKRSLEEGDDVSETPYGEVNAVWIGTVEVAGYQWVVAGPDEVTCENALLAEWHRFAKKETPHHECPPAEADWNQFSDYFGAYIRKARFGEVEWA